MRSFQFAFIGLVSVALCGGSPEESCAQESGMVDDRNLASVQQLYQVRLKALDDKLAAAEKDLAAKYESTLITVAGQAQKEGRLEALLAIRREQDRFAKEASVPKELDRGGSPAVVKWQEVYNREFAKALSERDSGVSALTARYLNHLDLVKQELTKAGKLEDALAFMREYETIIEHESQQLPKNTAVSPSPTSAVPAVPGEGAVLSAQDLIRMMGMDMRVVMFARGGGGRLVGPRGGDAAPTMLHEGPNAVADGTLMLMGGRTLIEGLNDLLLASCRTMNAITIVVEFSTDELRQDGPARIVSFSKDGLLRNFSICQQGADLVLRLRTTDTDLNGTKPEVRLGKIEKDEKHKLVVTYKPGDLRVHLDGKRVDVSSITGDFSNWEPCQLVLGNEWKEDRPWLGKLNKVTLHARFMEDFESVLNTAQPQRQRPQQRPQQRHQR